MSSPLSDGTVLWHQSIAGSVDLQSVIFSGVVYVNSYEGQNGPDHVYALRASNGSIIWRYTPNGYTYIASTTGADGTLYLSSQNGIFALQASSGHVLWHYATQGSDDDWPVVVNGVVYATTSVNGQSAELFALRANDGAILWHYLLGNGADSWAGWLTVGNGIVYASSYADTNGDMSDEAGDIYALQSSTGTAMWHDRIQASSSSALLAGGVIYLVGSYNNSTASVAYALRAGDGAYLWNYSMSGYVYDAPVQSGTTLYIAGVNGMVYALHTGNGAILWYYTTNVGM